MYSDGEARAIDTDSSGEATLLSPITKHRRIYHAGQIPDAPLPEEKTSGA
ncbi:hypothetical protein GCM10010244_84910 [Streptomyces coeruleorubidus]|nr:hypothetical protein GCM10010244_84910 [Streptomyces bellus]